MTPEKLLKTIADSIDTESWHMEAAKHANECISRMSDEDFQLKCSITYDVYKEDVPRLVAMAVKAVYAHGTVFKEYQELLAENKKLREANEILAKEQNV